MTQFLIIILLSMSCSYISGCGYAIRGGTPTIGNGELRPYKLFGGFFCLVAFTSIPFFFHLHPSAALKFSLLDIHFNPHPFWFAAAYAIGWYLTIAGPWQGCYSIGASRSPRRSLPFPIDFILVKIFGKQWITIQQHENLRAGEKYAPYEVQLQIRSNRWRILRDGTGDFLRMCFCWVLFLSLGLLINPSWYSVMVASVFTASFAILDVLIYGWYNWLIAPRFYDIDGGGKHQYINFSEFLTGVLLFVLPACELLILR